MKFTILFATIVALMLQMIAAQSTTTLTITVVSASTATSTVPSSSSIVSAAIPSANRNATIGSTGLASVGSTSTAISPAISSVVTASALPNNYLGAAPMDKANMVAVGVVGAAALIFGGL